MIFNVIGVMPKRIASIAIKYYGAKAQKIKAMLAIWNNQRTDDNKDYKKEAQFYFIILWIILVLWIATMILSRFGVIKWL